MRPRVILTSRRHVTPIMSTPTPPPTPAEPLTSRYTPAQTLALLSLKDTDLAKAVFAKLRQGTARATPETMAELVEMRMAVRKANGTHQLNPMGSFIATALASDLLCTDVRKAS